MKAAQYFALSIKDDVKSAINVNEEVARPISKVGHAVVKVFSAAINPVDDKLFKYGFWWDRCQFPFTPGTDFSGVIESIGASGGDETAGFKVGDAVFCCNWGKGRHDEEGCEDTIGGAFAEYIIVPVHKLSKKPEKISFDAAAGIALVGTTALQALERGSVSVGKKVLILGGAGGVGQVALRIAKLKGAWVATTASARNVELCKALGADRVYDYNAERWEDDSNLKNIDAVLDLVGEANFFARGCAAGTVKPTGAYVSILPGSDSSLGNDPAGHLPLAHAAAFVLNQSPRNQDQLAQYLSSGDLECKIDSVYPFTTEGVNAMFDRISSGKAVGKCILKLI